jgi:hypothetical protein
MNNCVTTPSGQACSSTSDWKSCKPWDITQQSRTNCIADAYIQETLSIAGAQVNVYIMLGIHEQTKLIDLIGNGQAISGGDAVNYPASNAFDKLSTEWHSRQSGDQLISSGYIGYDFGVLKIPNGRVQYGIPTSVYNEITTIKIKQSVNEHSRVTKARIERSNDGIVWYGVAVVNLPNNDALNDIHFKQSAPMRYWRLRPIDFVGGECNSWGIQALEMHEYLVTNTSNIQDKILLENRNRNYSDTPVTLKGYYELVQANTDLQRFGIEMAANYTIRVNFNSCVALMNRPIIIGDVIELPSETQYTTDLKPIKRYLEVTDVTWDSQSYTPGWMPTMLLITALPALASEETQDIFGDLFANVDNSGLFDNNDGNNTMYQDFSAVDQTIRNKALEDVPEKGSEGSNVIREFEQNEIDAAIQHKFPHISKYGLNRTGLYVEDAMPQNDAPFTEGTTFPTTYNDGDYHRLVYEGLAKDVPARLYRYSEPKARWIYLETDKRHEFNGQKKLLEEYMTNPSKIPARDVKNGLIILKK